MHPGIFRQSMSVVVLACIGLSTFDRQYLSASSAALRRLFRATGCAEHVV